MQKQKKLRKHKKIVATLIFIAIFFIINSLLGFALVPSGTARVVLHELQSSNDYKCVFIGSSHGAYGIDADTVTEQTGKKTISLCMGGEYLQDSYYLLRRAFATNTPDTIVLDLDFDYLNAEKSNKGSVSASSIYNSFPLCYDKLFYFKDKILSLDYRAAFFPWMDFRDNFKGANAILKTKLTSAYFNYSPDAINMSPNNIYMGNGFIYRVANKHKESLGHLNWDESKVDQSSVEYLKKIIDLCKSKGTKIVIISVPVPVEQITYSLDEFNEAYTYLAKLAADNDVEYYNFNLIKNTVFPRVIDDYNDYDGHMNGDTAQRFSVVLGNFLKDLESDQLTTSDYFYDSIRDIQ